MKSVLNQLRERCVIVADTGDLEAIKRLNPHDATTNPSLVLSAVETGDYDNIIQDLAVRYQNTDKQKQRSLELMAEELAVEIGAMILQHIPGRVSTEVNARHSFDVNASIASAHNIIRLYQEKGVPRDRVLIKLAATWEGICAARQLENEGIHCNLTLIFSVVQAKACSEAGVFLISPFVGRVLDWHKNRFPDTVYEPEREPGVDQVRQILAYYKVKKSPTIVMAASFRNTGEIKALRGCQYLTISPALLDELSGDFEVLEDSARDLDMSNDDSLMTESRFRFLMNQDAMATEKLAEGIRGFVIDQVKLENLIAERL